MLSLIRAEAERVLREALVRVFQASGELLESWVAQVAYPSDSPLAHVAVPCHALARNLKMSPQAIASLLAADLQNARGKSLLKEARAVGGYLNFSVDVDALFRPMLSRNPKLTPEMVEPIIELYGRMLGLFGALGVLVGLPSLSLFLAWIFWLVGRAAPGPGGSPSYRQALSAAVVPGLVSLPKALLIGSLCLLRPVRGLMPDALSPLSLGAWLGPGHGKLQALLTGFDGFLIANLILLFLAARHLLGFKRGAALVSTAAAAAVIAGLVVMNR